MAGLMPFDEINKFEVTLSDHFEVDPETGKRRIKSKADCEDIIDEMLDLFLLSYAHGATSTNLDLSSEVEVPLDDVMKTVDKEIEGETWRQRVRDWYESGGDEADIMRIVETESHRDANAGAYEVAIRAGATTKTWNTMRDGRVRDTHDYLEGVTTPIDGVFYSFKGGSTYYPGQWGIAEEDINCRCWLTYR